MQVGDLVELSAAGKKAKQNSEVYGYWGIIMKIDGFNHPYRIDWFRPDGSLKRVPMARYEIKFMRGKK
jgi:hypothetical protein